VRTWPIARTKPGRMRNNPGDWVRSAVTAVLQIDGNGFGGRSVP
jgi:hypothetical protein